MAQEDIVEKVGAPMTANLEKLRNLGRKAREARAANVKSGAVHPGNKL